MAMPPLGFAAYAVGTLASTSAVVAHAFITRTHFYPAVVYLSTTKYCLFVLGNFALFTLIAFARMLRFVFFGKLHENEQRVLQERSWFALTESLLALTIFRDEFNLTFVAAFACLVLAKVFHWLAQERVNHIEHFPRVTVWTHLRLCSLLLILGLIDLAVVAHAGRSLLHHGPSGQLLFAFEYLVLFILLIGVAWKYSIFFALRFFGTERRGYYLFIGELVSHFAQLLAYLAFFAVVTRYYGLPLHIVHDVYSTFMTFRERLAAFVAYRRLMTHLDAYFPDASAAQLADNRFCVVCHQDMQAAKTLPCGHYFHRECLSSWLEQRQTCPLCNTAVDTRRLHQQHQQRQQQQQQQQRAAPPPVLAPAPVAGAAPGAGAAAAGPAAGHPPARAAAAAAPAAPNATVAAAAAPVPADAAAAAALAAVLLAGGMPAAAGAAAPAADAALLQQLVALQQQQLELLTALAERQMALTARMEAMEGMVRDLAQMPRLQDELRALRERQQP